MKIAVIGSGGREHAIAWKFAQSLGWEQVFTLPGNGGIPNSHLVDFNDFDAVHQFCKQKDIELIFVGPEVPLSKGIVDYFRKNTSIAIFGPTRNAARLESSKIFAKHFMQKYGVATAPFKTFDAIKEATTYASSKRGNLVIKFDGLAAGKGVYVCDNMQEVTLALQELEQTYGEQLQFLIEDKIIGDEISVIGFTDGKDIQLLAPSQDHKQLLDGDLGPNTGGMGAICPVPFCDDKLMQLIRKNIVEPTLKGLNSEGFDYRGVIYFGIMIDQNGPKLLEYNVRLGDPETEVILPCLKNNLEELTLACLDGTIGQLTVDFHEGYFVNVVQVSGGYPKSYQKGLVIEGLDQIKDVLVFHAGTRKQKDQILSNGGRVLNITANAMLLQQAIKKAYAACEKIHFQDNFYRKDIGQRKSILVKD